MLAAFFAVAGKVLVLFLMIAAGYFCFQHGMVTSRGASQLTNILISVATPCVIISAFQIEGSGLNLQKLAVCTIAACVGHLGPIALSLLLYRKKPEKRKKLLRYAVVYSNTGFMGIPVVEAVLGESAVPYASIYVVVFNLFTWTHGYLSLTGERGGILKKALVNPGTIGLAVGLPLFLLGVHLPEIPLTVIDSFSALNTPLSMLVIGTYIARIPWKEFFSEREIFSVSAFRLLVSPALFLVLLYPFRIDPVIYCACALVSGMPAAANTVLFSVMVHNPHAKLASKIVAVTTLFSILTLPLVTIVAERLSGLL